MTLADWKLQYAIGPLAYAALLELLASNDHAPEPQDPLDLRSEAYVQSVVRLEAPKHGYWFTRNNVGAWMDPVTRRPTRYGLANESSAQNNVIKSGDLIGFYKRVIVHADVGNVIAQFASAECKKEGWQYKATKREQAQAAWRDFINANGGDARFVSDPGSFSLRSNS